VQDAFDRLLARYPDVDAVLLSTGDGVPLIRGTLIMPYNIFKHGLAHQVLA
jgi:uncharacterized protein (DUF433 family)